MIFFFYTKNCILCLIFNQFLAVIVLKKNRFPDVLLNTRYACYTKCFQTYLMIIYIRLMWFVLLVVSFLYPPPPANFQRHVLQKIRFVFTLFIQQNK